MNKNKEKNNKIGKIKTKGKAQIFFVDNIVYDKEEIKQIKIIKVVNKKNS